MFGFLLAFLLPAVIYAVVRASGPSRSGLAPTLIIAYALRVALQPIIRDLPLFSHGAGGDFVIYENFATIIAKVWHYTGVHFITAEELPDIGTASLPQNLFALVIYLNDGPSPTGCTAIIALCASLTCLNVYRLACTLGAEEHIAFRVMLVILFSPAFFFYTSDMYKDGLVLFFVVGALASAIRLSRRFSFVHAAIALLCAWALWYVRYYLIFVTLGPLLVGLSGIGSKSVVRPLMAGLGLTIILIVVSVSTSVFERANETATNAFAFGTAQNTLESNASTGSGITFDDGGSPFGSIWLKLLYTLFAPFPWQGGSFGLQLGKVEALISYYFAYRAFKSARSLWRIEPSLVLMFGAFIVPTTLMYATIMTNIGLIVRERMPVVVVIALLATIGWSLERKPREDELASASSAGLAGLQPSRERQ